MRREPFLQNWGRITRKASKTVVGQCKGMDRAELERDVEGARGPSGLENPVSRIAPIYTTQNLLRIIPFL